jgi:hypothetical protein
MSTPRSTQVNLGTQLIALVVFALQQHAQHPWLLTTGRPRTISAARTDITLTSQGEALILEWIPRECVAPTKLTIEPSIITMHVVARTHRHYEVVVNALSRAAVIFFANEYARLGEVPDESPRIEEIFDVLPVLVVSS